MLCHTRMAATPFQARPQSDVLAELTLSQSALEYVQCISLCWIRRDSVRQLKAAYREARGCSPCRPERKKTLRVPVQGKTDDGIPPTVAASAYSDKWTCRTYSYKVRRVTAFYPSVAYVSIRTWRWMRGSGAQAVFNGSRQAQSRQKPSPRRWREWSSKGWQWPSEA